jgi:hypothetical protein
LNILIDVMAVVGAVATALSAALAGVYRANRKPKAGK